MNDCSNAEIRDQLPDLLHERLDASVRAAIAAHVADCVDCRDELELLRSIHKTLIARTPRVDVAYVVGALPKAPAAARVATPSRIHAPAHRRWSDWRIAAAVTVLVAGGSSLAVLRRTPTTIETRPPITDTAVSRPAPVAPVAGQETPAPGTAAPNSVAPVAKTADTDASTEDGPDGRFAGLSDAQMQALLGEIDRLQAVPVTEPDPVTIRVDLKPGGAENLR